MAALLRQQNGLQFDFREDTPQEHDLTGHANGKITMNIAEADDVHRESTRVSMREPHRTLPGRFRHGTGHYYFDRLVANTPWIKPFRRLVRRRAHRLRQGPGGVLLHWPGAGLGRTVRERVRGVASLGRMGRNVGALPAYHRDDRHGHRLWPRTSTSCLPTLTCAVPSPPSTAG